MSTPARPRQGLWVDLLTPFRRGVVDTDLVADHARWLLGHGVRALSPTGDAGEFLYLTPAEKLAVYTAVAGATSGRAGLWPTVWEPQLDAIRDTVRWLAPHDVTGVLIPPPLYYRFSEEELVWYYRRLADACPLPIVAVHRPHSTRNPLSTTVLRALVVEGLITGVLDASGDMRRLDQLVEEFSGQLDMYWAHDGTIREARTRGATGCVSILGNAFPELVRQAWERADEEAQALIDRLIDAAERHGLVSACKYMLLRRGYQFGNRPPFERLTPPQQQALDAAFQIVQSEGFAEAQRLA